MNKETKKDFYTRAKIEILAAYGATTYGKLKYSLGYINGLFEAEAITAEEWDKLQTLIFRLYA